ncbi:TBPIP domain-containing protein, putative [Babesia ovata]|uniref:TBPIP domain-containing protein, putative n=1 Tax=Babesia ovata TaxID=189622 RepID=A0A2H6KAU8_9APIC|nr:TBPIP domain-containing protein, putative [Babesia ovata]GBE60121.1 TBPIP domain-containing protein, putative [Babesia ovata]
MKTAMIPTRTRAKRAYPVITTPVVAAKPALSETTVLLSYLRDMMRPCGLLEIHEKMGLQMDKQHLVQLLDGLVAQGHLRCKKCPSIQIYVYNFSNQQKPSAVPTTKVRKPNKAALEKEAAQLRAATEEITTKIQETQQRCKELAALQERQKAALDDWHVLLKADGDPRAMARACGGEVEHLMDAQTKQRAELGRLQRLYTHMVTAVSDIEGVHPRQLCERLGIEITRVQLKNK